MVHVVTKAQQHMQQARSTAMWHIWVQGHNKVGACPVLSLPHVITIIIIDSGA